MSKKLLLFAMFFCISVATISQSNPYGDNNKNGNKGSTTKPQKQTSDVSEIQSRYDRKVNSSSLDSKSTADGLSAFFNLFTSLKDRWTPNWGYMKFQIGLGYEARPLVMNYDNVGISKTGTAKLFNIYSGFKIGLFNSCGISLHLNPFFNYGYSGLTSGAAGGLTSYGSSATLFVSKKSTSKLKPFIEGAYQSFSGNYGFDDNQGAVSISTINYQNIRIGAGIMFHFIDDYEFTESYIKPAIYFEKPSFLKSETSPVMVAGLQIGIENEIIIEADYSKNYFIPGVIDYKSNLERGNQNYFNIKIIRNGILF